MKKLWKWLVIALGTISWSWTMVKSGWVTSLGLGFWGANGHDGIWHLALIESLSKGSFEMPVFSGHLIQNYHIGFDLILAVLHRITSIPVSYLYFQIAPPVLAALIGILTYRFVENWTKSQMSALWATFFVYFGGSFSWILGKGESAFWSTQAISTLINPPFALSLIFLLLGMTILIKEKKKFIDYLLAVFLFGVLIEIKSYAGILALGGLFVTGLYSLLLNKKSATFKIFAGALALSLLIFIPLNKSSVGLVIWSPFWFLESMIAGDDRLYLPKLAEAMLSFKNQHVLRKFIPTYLGIFAIFIIGNFGTRIIFLIRKIRKTKELDVFVYSVILAGIIIPTFFVQAGTPWNTIQFIYYSLFFAGIIAGTVLSRTNIFITIAVILLTIPTTLFTLKDVYVPGRPPAILPSAEVQALSFLAKEANGVVLTYPFDQDASSKWTTAPKPLYLYTSTAYVSAFSKKDVFLEDYGNLDITNYAWPQRLEELKAWYKENNQAIARQFLKAKNIKYIYWLKGQRALLGDKQLGLTNIFENSEVTIYKVD